MKDFITLSCPSCGGKLEITDDIEQFACGYCGTEHIIRRSGGIVALKPVVDGLSRIQTGTDRTASELAIVRLGQEIPPIESEINSIIIDVFSADLKGIRKTILAMRIVKKSWFNESVGLKIIESFSASDTDSLITAYSKKINFLNRSTRNRNIPRLETIRNLKEELSNKQSRLERHKQLVAL